MTVSDDFDEATATDEYEPTEPDAYGILGIQPDATPAEVRQAYLRKVREHPPERDPEGFKRVREAYETLRSPRKRAELALMELRRGPAEFDLDRLHETPPPPFPTRYVDHLLAVLLDEVDARIDALAVQLAGSGGLTSAAPTTDGAREAAR